MSRPSFSNDEYAAGFEAVRTLLPAALQQLPAGNHAGSFMIGAFCAIVRLIWDGRDATASRSKVAGILGSVIADVLRDADGAEQVGDGAGVAYLVEAFQAAAANAAPRDSQGQPQIAGDQVLDALGAYAAELLLSLKDPFVRQIRLGEFEVYLADYLDQLVDATGGRRLAPIQGGLQ